MRRYGSLAVTIGLALVLLVQATARGQSPPGCSVNNLNADIAFPPVFATVECGTTVPFTVKVTNGTDAGACDISDLPVTFLCPDPATGDPTGPVTILAPFPPGDDFTADPPSSKTYPAADCVIGDSSGPVCSCGTATGVYQARVHAGPGILELNPAHIDIADVIKTVSVQCITTTTTTTTSTTTSTTLPHFQCYETRSRAAIPVAVTLVDQFGTWSLSARRTERLCAPVDKNDENPGAPQIPDHLVGYDLRETHGVFPARRNLEVTNQFGTIRVDATGFSRLLVPAAKSLVAPPPPLVGGGVDHFLCYTVRLPGTAKFNTVKGVKLIDQFGTKTVDLVKPRYLCNPVNKNGESPGAETHVTHLLCYDVKVNRENLNISPVFTNDQFGSKSLELIRRDELCVPSTKMD